MNLTQACDALAGGERVTADEMPEGTHWKTKERGTAALWSSGGSVLLYPEHASWHFHIVPKPKSRLRKMAEAHLENRHRCGADHLTDKEEEFAREVVHAVAEFVEGDSVRDTLALETAIRIRREFLEPR